MHYCNSRLIWSKFSCGTSVADKMQNISNWNTTIPLTNFSDGQSGSLTVTNAATQYTLNIVQSGSVNAISKSIGTTGNYTKLNTTDA